MQITIRTNKKIEIIDITNKVEKSVKKFENGIVFLYLPHCTAALIVNEYEPHIEKDYIKFLSKTFEGKWEHDKIDNNASAHLGSAFIGGEKYFFVENGELALGTWQRILLVELDGPRERKILVKFIKS